MSQDTDAAMLNATLAQLPRLRGLHVIGCPRITHITILKALSHTPDLRELSLTIFVSFSISRPVPSFTSPQPSQEHGIPPLNFAVPPLTHLAIDIRASYPGLKSLVARIVSRLAPRDALAICGGWIGEVKSSSERTDAQPDPGPANSPDGPAPAGPGGGGGGPLGQNFHVWQGHVHYGLANGQVNDPPLLSPPHPYGNPHPNQNPVVPPPFPGNPNMFGFPFPFFIGNPNGNNNDPPDAGPPNLPNPDVDHDPNSPSLVSSLPSTLSILHLPQISPAGLREVVDRCQGIQVLGIVVGNAFSSPGSAKPSKLPGRSINRFKGHAARSDVRTEVSVLAAILARARALQELIIDTSAADFAVNNSGPAGAGASHSAPFTGYALLTPVSTRLLMRESRFLRRIVGEGRVWEVRFSFCICRPGQLWIHSPLRPSRRRPSLSRTASLSNSR